MNIPRQFYGMNYISRLFENFQDSERSVCSKLQFYEIEDVTPVPLIKKDSYALGLNAEVISELLRKMVSDRRCALDGFAIARNEELLFAEYRYPYSEDIPHVTNSSCKTVVAIAVMFAISEGLMEENDLVLSFFPEYESVVTPKAMKQMTIWHLLTMTSGSKCTEIASVVESNWVKAFLLTDCQFEPGTQFIYNSMNTYILAAILTKVTGMSLMDYLKPRLWEPLGINHIKWELCPEGIERGGWGLHISLEGMLKIGMFLMNDGSFRGKQLIEASYIKKMKQTTIEQKADALATGYGYQLWHLPNGVYMLSGMYGQNVIIDEEHRLVVATNAHSDKMFPDSYLVSDILEYLGKEELFVPGSILKERLSYNNLLKELECFKKGWKLQKTTDKAPFILYAKKQMLQKGKELAVLQKSLTVFDGKRIHIDQTTIKLFPYMLQGMYQCPPFHVTDIAFKVETDRVKLCFYKERSRKEKRESRERARLILEAGLNEYCYQTVTIGLDEKLIAVKMYPATDEDGHRVVMVDIVFPDAGFSRVMKFFLLERRIGIECQEYPDMRAIVEQVIYGETVLAGNSIDLSNKLPESVRLFLEHKVEPKVNGYFL